MLGLSQFSKQLSQVVESRRSHRLALAVLYLVEPFLGLLAERGAMKRLNNLFEMPPIRSAGRDYFLGLAFPFGC